MSMTMTNRRFNTKTGRVSQFDLTRVDDVDARIPTQMQQLMLESIPEMRGPHRPLATLSIPHAGDRGLRLTTWDMGVVLWGLRTAGATNPQCTTILRAILRGEQVEVDLPCLSVTIVWQRPDEHSAEHEFMERLQHRLASPRPAPDPRGV